MTRLWQKISENILAPSQLNGGQIFDMLTPSGRGMELRRHAAAVIMARVQLTAGLFAILVPLCSIVDVLVFDGDTVITLVGLRLLSALIFVTLAWPRELSLTRPYTQAMTALLVLLLVPSLFHLFSAETLASASQTDTQRLVVQLYTYLPTVVLGGLAIFPLTALEALLLALPVIALSLYGTTLSGHALELAQYGSTLWFMLMMLGVAMFSGMSQCHYMATLVVKAMHDPLTGALTRRSGEEALALLFRLSHMSGKPLTLAFIDLDRFKSINDSFGHEAGDQCLRSLVENISQALRRGDLLVRWGGEEFIAILPDTPPDNVASLLQRLRDSGLGRRPDGAPLTASIGIASTSEVDLGSWESMVQRADLRMYEAKQRGRDSVVWADDRWQPMAQLSQAAPAG